MGDERGVSDVVAFVFVFSIIITSVGVVSAFGFEVLRDIQNDEQAVNAVRGMEALGDNLGNVQRGHAPGRSGELKLSEGTVFVRQNSQVEIDVQCTASSYLCDNVLTFDVGTLYYDMTDRETQVTYEGGAVFRKDRKGSPVMVSTPQFICGSDHAVVSIVTLVSDGEARGGGGTVQISGRERKTKLFTTVPADSANQVTVDFTNSRFESAWDSYFSDDDNQWTSTGGGAGECAAEHIYVRQTVIEIDFVT